MMVRSFGEMFWNYPTIPLLFKKQKFRNYLAISHDSTTTEHPSVIIYVCHRVWEVQLLRPESIGLHFDNFVRMISKHLWVVFGSKKNCSCLINVTPASMDPDQRSTIRSIWISNSSPSRRGRLLITGKLKLWICTFLAFRCSPHECAGSSDQVHCMQSRPNRTIDDR